MKIEIQKPPHALLPTFFVKDGLIIIQPRSQLEFMFKFFQRLYIIVYSDAINDLMFLLLCYLKECDSYSLDLRFLNFECFYRLEKFLDSLPIKTCAEIHLDGEEYFATVEQPVHSLISKCIQKTEWLFIKDFNIDFSSFREANYCS